jgi:hypothetical protein
MPRSYQCLAPDMFATALLCKGERLDGVVLSSAVVVFR